MARRDSGFTLIEMTIVIVIIVILTVLGTAGFSSYQVNARDTERANDIASIQRGLEAYYKNGNAYLKSSGQGGYPGANVFMHMAGWNWNDNNPGHCEATYVTGKCHIKGGYLSDALPGVTKSSLYAPGSSDFRLNSTWLQPDRNPATILNDYIETAVDRDQYIYKPMDTNNVTTCYETSCPRYALIYKEEATGDIKIVKSNRQ